LRAPLTGVWRAPRRAGGRGAQRAPAPHPDAPARCAARTLRATRVHTSRRRRVQRDERGHARTLQLLWTYRACLTRCRIRARRDADAASLAQRTSREACDAAEVCTQPTQSLALACASHTHARIHPSLAAALTRHAVRLRLLCRAAAHQHRRGGAAAARRLRQPATVELTRLHIFPSSVVHFRFRCAAAAAAAGAPCAHAAHAPRPPRHDAAAAAAAWPPPPPLQRQPLPAKAAEADAAATAAAAAAALHGAAERHSDGSERCACPPPHARMTLCVN
jgi:hypothetical protein